MIARSVIGFVGLAVARKRNRRVGLEMVGG